MGGFWGLVDLAGLWASVFASEAEPKRALVRVGIHVSEEVGAGYDAISGEGDRPGPTGAGAIGAFDLENDVIIVAVLPLSFDADALSVAPDFHRELPVAAEVAFEAIDSPRLVRNGEIATTPFLELEFLVIPASTATAPAAAWTVVIPASAATEAAAVPSAIEVAV